MDHTGVVGRGTRFADLDRQPERFVYRQRAAFQPVAQVFARNQFHREEAKTLHLMQPVNSGDTGVIQRGKQTRLTLETGQPIGVFRKRSGQQLDRNLATEVGIERLPDYTHAALADLFDKPVVQKFLA